MSPEGNVPINSGDGGSNIKFYAILIAVVLVAGIVALAWVMSEDDGNSQISVPVLPAYAPVSDFSFSLPENIQYCLEFYDDRFYVENFGVFENCAVRLDDWWRWETEDNKFGYREYKDSMLLVGPVKIFNLAGNSENVGTPSETGQ